MLNISVLGNYDLTIYAKQIPVGFEKKNDIKFSFDGSLDSDGFVILNQVAQHTQLRAKPSMILRINQEPYLPRIFPWQDCKKIEGVVDQGWFRTRHHNEISNLVLPWHITNSFDELIGNTHLPKVELISLVASTKVAFPGHQSRHDFIQKARQRFGTEIQFFGKGIKFIENKQDALLPFMYSLALENTKQDGYWTEKIVDCILCNTVPIYFGSELPPQIFPPGSYIRLDELSVETFETIYDMLSEHDYYSRLPSVLAAKKNLLRHHSFFPQIAKFFRGKTLGEHISYTSYEFKPRYTITQKIKNLLQI